MAQGVGGNITVNTVSVDYTMMLPRGCADQQNGAVGRRAIIVQHGHATGTGRWSNSISAAQSFIDHPRAWADAGYVVASVNTGGTAWYDQDAHDRIAALRTRLTTVLGCKTKVGLSGWSMGGGTILSWAMLNPTLVAAMYPFAPALDLRWVAGKAGYVPAYAVGADVAGAGWATEIGSDYPVGYDAHDPLQNLALFRGLAFRIRIAHATDDTTLPYAGAPYFVAQVNDPQVTFRLPDVTGGHQGPILNIPTAETLAFFVNNWVG